MNKGRKVVEEEKERDLEREGHRRVERRERQKDGMVGNGQATKEDGRNEDPNTWYVIT